MQGLRLTVSWSADPSPSTTLGPVQDRQQETWLNPQIQQQELHLLRLGSLCLPSTS